MKKSLAITLSLALSLSLIACNEDAKPTKPTSPQNQLPTSEYKYQAPPEPVQEVVPVSYPREISVSDFISEVKGYWVHEKTTYEGKTEAHLFWFYGGNKLNTAIYQTGYNDREIRITHVTETSANNYTVDVYAPEASITWGTDVEIHPAFSKIYKIELLPPAPVIGTPLIKIDGDTYSYAGETKEESYAACDKLLYSTVTNNESDENNKPIQNPSSSTTQTKSDMKADCWYTPVSHNELKFQNAEVSSVVPMSNGSVYMVNYFPVCSSCHTLGIIQMTGVGLHNPVTEANSCPNCKTVTYSRFKIEF